MNNSRKNNNSAFLSRDSLFIIHYSPRPCFACTKHGRGFSLLELLIVIAIMMIIAVAGSGMYRGFVKNVEIKSTARTTVADLKQMQSKAMTGEGGFKWGAHVVNGTPDDYYVLFSTSGTSYADGTTVSVATTTLPIGITFSSPTSGNFTDIIFNKISGTTTATTVSITSEGATQTVTVSGVGAIY